MTFYTKYNGGIMTNIAIHDDLLHQVIQLSGLTDKKMAINNALAEYIDNRKKQNLINMFGTVEYYDDYDPKQTRKGDATINCQFLR